MAFHDKTKDGNMKQETVVTIVTNLKPDTLIAGFKKHDEKVSKFNSEHNVFFNQIAPTLLLSGEQILISTVCLYADGAKK